MVADPYCCLTLLHRVVDSAAEGTWFGRLLTQLGLDPGNPSLGAIVNALLERAFANLHAGHVLIVLGATFYVATLLMRTIVPLRICNIISDLFFLSFGVLVSSVTMIILYLLLLPINIVRLYQMLMLIRKARSCAQHDLSMDWLNPFMTPRKYRKGHWRRDEGDVE